MKLNYVINNKRSTHYTHSNRQENLFENVHDTFFL